MTGSHRLLCLEMVYLLWLSPHPGFRLSLHTTPLHVSLLWGLSRGLYWPDHDAVDDVCLSLRERLDTGPPSGLGRRQGALQNCWVQNLSPGPEGLPATSGLLCSFRRWIALLEGVADSEWLGEPLRDLSQWLSENWSSCVCEKNQCPDTGCRPGS